MKQYTRRGILTSGGAAAGSFLAAGGQAKEVEHQPDLDPVLESPKIQSILGRLGHPAPEKTEFEYYHYMGPVKLLIDRAERHSIEDLDISAYQIPTTHGMLGYLDMGSTDEAMFSPFEQAEWHLQRLLPDVSWPDGVSSGIIGGKDNTLFGCVESLDGGGTSQ